MRRSLLGGAGDLSMCVAPVRGTKSTGTIRGTVTDPSGAVVTEPKSRRAIPPTVTAAP